MNHFLLLLFCLATLCPSAQDVTIINNFPGVEGSVDPNSYVLGKVTQQTIVVNEYEPIQSGVKAQLEQMIRYGLRSYIDSQYYTEKGKVAALPRKDAFAEGALGVVRNALWITDQPFQNEFKGFSDKVLFKAAEIKALDGYRIEKEGTPGMPAGRSAVNLYTYQRMVYDLKIQAEQEAFNFIGRHIEEQGNALGDDDGPTAPIKPIDFTLDKSPTDRDNLIALKPVPMPRSMRDERRQRRRKLADSGGLNAQVVKLLEENNKILSNYSIRFDDLQTQINQIKGERSTTVDVLRTEMQAIREMLQGFVSGSVAGSTPAVGVKQVLIFEKNMHQLALAHRAQLSQVELDMKVDKSLIAVITGFADRTGNANYNVWLSEQRANAVFKFLREKGIDTDRIVVNYMGDVESRFPNPADRKVEVTFVKGR